MKTILLNKSTKELLKKYSEEGESFNQTVIRLLDESDDSFYSNEMDFSRTNISLHDETLERLKEYKIKPKEAHSDTILRLLLTVCK